MTKSKKWSEQTLTEQSFKVQENGQEVVKSQNVLQVCTSGMNLYRKYFVEGEYKGKNRLIVPFDMVVLAGNPCPDGRFYELEYTIGSQYGYIYRALIQAVNPVTDIRLIIGKLIASNILSKEFYPRKAWLRDDIDMVCIGGCYVDPEDGPTLSHSIHEATDSDMSVLDFALGKGGDHGPNDVCLCYYRGDCREVWISGHEKFDTPDIMVCGSDNVNDPAFAQQRAADMMELRDHLAEIQSLCNDYSIPFFMFVAIGGVGEGGRMKADFSGNVGAPFMHKVIDAATKVKNEE